MADHHHHHHLPDHAPSPEGVARRHRFDMLLGSARFRLLAVGLVGGCLWGVLWLAVRVA